MYCLTVLLCSIAVVVSDPKPIQSWPSQFPQTTAPSNWQSGSGIGGRVDPRGPGWGPGSSSSSWGSGSGPSDSSGDSGWGSRRCGGTVRRSRSAPSIFDIERQLLSSAQKMLQFCTAYSDRPLREVYGVEHFTLRVQLSEFSEDDIQVRVRQRLVTVMANTCAAEYAVVRVLPDVVDARRAVWKMEGHLLTVLFPYNITPDTEIQSRCGREFHGDPIIVPKVAAGTQFARDYDVSFNNATLRQAIKQALRELAREDNEQYIDD